MLVRHHQRRQKLCVINFHFSLLKQFKIMSNSIEFILLSEAVKVGYRNEAEREFLISLHNHFPEWQRFGLTDDYSCVAIYDSYPLMIAFDICDRQKILSSLRVDFTGTSILMCDLGTASNLFDSQLKANQPDVKEYRKIGGSPTDFANMAATWVSSELLRYFKKP